MHGPYILSLRDDADLDRVVGGLAALGLWTRRLEVGSGPRLVEVDARSRAVTAAELGLLPGVAHVAGHASAHPLVDARAGQPVVAGGVPIGPGQAPVFMAGPCAVESESQIARLAEHVAASGARFLRGSAYKPRTSPYAFQGHGPPALAWLRAAADRAGLAVVTEVMAPEDAGRVAEVADLLQVGSRSMQSFALLKAVGRQKRPVLLKRGMSATVEDWLLAAEYCLAEGATGVVFCERGLRGFNPSTRNLLNLGSVALLAHALGQPVVVDPSHAAGRRNLIPPLAAAALAAGAHGLVVETHDDPAHALSDGPQAIPPAELAAIFPGRALMSAALPEEGLPATVQPGSGAMFNRIARRYDLLNRVLSFGIDRGWRRKAVRALGDAGRVLDLATGTGDLAVEIARMLPRATVVGSDPSAEMLAVGQEKLARLALEERVTLERGDAQALPYPDRSFDGVTIAFGIRNVPDRPRALAEMARVTRDGGRVVILELSEPRGGLLAPLARWHVHWLVPRLGALLSGAPEYRYLERSIARFPPADEFARTMADAGLRPLATTALTFGVAHLYVAEPARPQPVDASVEARS